MKRVFCALLVCAAIFVACGDDDSDDFLARPNNTAYSSDEDEPESSSARSSSSSEWRSSSSSVNSSSSEYSSSSMRSSSSSNWLDTIPHIPPCRDEYEDNCIYGELVDTRDGRTYRTVEIGNQTWMAENLHFESENSECYEDSLELCDNYGRLYPWAEAMEVCPSGWHLPSLDEWKILYTYAGGINTSASKLRSAKGWECYNCEGTDDYGFSVLPAGGYRNKYSRFQELHVIAYFWTSTDYAGKEDNVYNICFDERDWIIDGNGPKTENTFSIRCIKD